MLRDEGIGPKQRWLMNLGQKGVFHSQFYKTLSANAVGRGTQSGQEPEGKGWWRGHGGELFTGLFTMLPYRTQDHQPGDSTIHNSRHKTSRIESLIILNVETKVQT